MLVAQKNHHFRKKGTQGKPDIDQVKQKLHPREKARVEGSAPEKKGMPKKTMFSCFADLCDQATNPDTDETDYRFG